MISLDGKSQAPCIPRLARSAGHLATLSLVLGTSFPHSLGLCRQRRVVWEQMATLQVVVRDMVGRSLEVRCSHGNLRFRGAFGRADEAVEGTPID